MAEIVSSDPALAERAARLAKTDLVTEMVLEFTELQGIMGQYYARHDGEPEEVAQALNEQYMPRFAGDDLPTTPTTRPNWIDAFVSRTTPLSATASASCGWHSTV